MIDWGFVVLLVLLVFGISLIVDRVVCEARELKMYEVWLIAVGFVFLCVTVIVWAMT